jgi:hypothetical protein
MNHLQNKKGGFRMLNRIVLSALTVLATFSLVATALAQPAPVRVVQSTDGALYLVQGGTAWLLVADQIGESDLAGLMVSGEVLGTIPRDLLAVPATPPQAEAPAPAPAAPPAPAPAPAPAVPMIDANRIVGDYTTTYGNQVGVTVSGSDGSYSIKSKTAFKPKGIGGVGNCVLPAGTVVATFFESGGSFSGQHGLWSSQCQFVQWADLSLSLKGTFLTGEMRTANNAAGGIAFSPLAITFSR